MRFFTKVLLAIVVVLGITAAWFWTPDTDYDAMLNKYTGGKHQFITLDDGTRVHFSDTGNSTAPALLLVHGTSDSLLTWRELEPYLENDFRLVSFDLPGHGFSSAPDSPTFSHFVRTGTELLDHLEIESAVWVGNSLGGGIAWRAALTRPEYVNGLVLLDTSGAPSAVRAKSNIGFKLLGNPVGRFFGRNITPRALVERSLAGTIWDADLVTKDRVDRYWELLRLPGNRQALANLAFLRRSDDNWQHIHEIEIPALVVWGAEDQVNPVENATVFSQAMKSAELNIYENVGHLPMVEAPQRLASDIREYISSLPKQGTAD